MTKRNFLKLTLATTCSLLTPKYIYAKEEDLSFVSFSTTIFEEANQTIIVFLAGGPSPLSANLSNREEIEASSQNSYKSYFNTNFTKIENGYDLWKEAGGESMQRLLDNQDMTIIRTCYSPERELLENKSHGVCSAQNMKGSFDLSKAGILTNLSRVMQMNGKYDSKLLPFVTLSGENDFYSGGDGERLKPISLNYKLENPFKQDMSSSSFYSNEERKKKDYKARKPLLDATFDAMAKSKNSVNMMNNFLDTKEDISTKIETIKSARIENNEDKNLALYGYTPSDVFHQTLATAIEVLDANPTTRTITLQTSGLGGWDDHSYAGQKYLRRMQNLFQGLEAGMKHLHAIKKNQKMSIIVYGEFGRNVNLNSAFGWDHGNLQNLFILGGSDYFNHVGGTDAIVGETVVDNEGKPRGGRVWLKPKEGSYSCEPFSVASTIYAIHGVNNPDALTGYPPINPNINGQDFFTI